MILPSRYQEVKEFTTAMNMLYTAFDTETKQRVVIKVMQGDMYDAERDQQRRELFQHEIDLTFYLDHPHILKAIDSGDVMLIQPRVSVPYITFPFLETGSLKQFVDRSPPWHEWSLLQTVDVILQAAYALDYIHQQYIPLSDSLSIPQIQRSLVHRDVKLENFLVRPEYTEKRIVHIFLNDFGIARTQRITGDATDHIFGTFKYMPPEQFEGSLDPHSDQYSLALMACFLLTGKNPFPYPDSIEQPEWYAWYRVHKSVAPKAPTELNPERIKSPEVDDAILRALSKEPEGRYPTILEFAEALDYAIQRQLALAPTVYVRPPSPKSSSPARQPQSLLTDLTNRDEDDIDAIPGKTISTTGNTPPLPEIDWQSLSNIVLQPLVEKQLPAIPQTVCWSHDGNYLASLFSDHAPIILDRQGSQKKGPQLESGHMACWTPGGYGLAISAQYTVGDEERSKILIVDNVLATTGRTFALETFPVPTIDGLDWSSKGELAAWISEENCIRLYAMPQMSLQHTLHMEGLDCGGIGTLRWSPDGALLAAGTRNGLLVCWQTGIYAKVWHKPLSHEQVYSLAWSPDSTCLAVSSGDRHLMIWNVREDRLVTEWKQLPMVPRMLSISNRRLLVAASRQPYLYFRDTGDNGITFVAKHPGTWLAAWSPTRPELATLHSKDDTMLVIWSM